LIDVSVPGLPVSGKWRHYPEKVGISKPKAQSPISNAIMKRIAVH
jgi:hypothetical protein